MENYYLNEGLKRLDQFDSTITIDENWNKRTIHTSDIENIQFYNSSVYHEKYKVPIKNIIGTSHVDYTNKTWLEVLGGAKEI